MRRLPGWLKELRDWLKEASTAGFFVLGSLVAAAIVPVATIGGGVAS